MLIVIACLVGLSSYALTSWYRVIALRRSFLDIPNDRSSHSLPTPRGGGIAILIATLVGALYLGSALGQLWPLGWLAVSALILGGISYWDDLCHIRPKWRFITQLIVVVVMICVLGGINHVHMINNVYSGNFLINAIALIAMIWLINLYNFMDGINGIAAGMAIAVCASILVLLKLSMSPIDLFILPAMLLASSIGFIVWNFPIAKIFMGDIGSCFIGFLFGVMILQIGHWNGIFYYLIPILLSPFIVDSSVTLIHRALRKQVLHQAHREHAYQHMATRFNSHTIITMAYLLITLCYLLPICIGILIGWIADWQGLVIAYVTLIPLALWCGAGKSAVRSS